MMFKNKRTHKLEYPQISTNSTHEIRNYVNKQYDIYESRINELNQENDEIKKGNDIIYKISCVLLFSFCLNIILLMDIFLQSIK
jgi:hypothetical protein